MKGFYISVKNDLLEPKHVKAMGEAVWLYMWLLDKMTSVNENGEGKVLHNTVITHEKVSLELGISRRTYQRYVDRLRDAGYISTVRAQQGLYIVVTKAKKQFTNKNRSATSDTSQINREDVPHLTHQDVPKTHIRSAKNGTSLYIDNNTNNNTNNTYVDSDKPKPRDNARVNQDYKNLLSELIVKLGFSDQVKVTPGRLTKLKARLKTYSRDELLTAAGNIADDDYMQGDNNGGKRYGTIDYLLRNDEKVDQWLHVTEKQTNYKADW